MVETYLRRRGHRGLESAQHIGDEYLEVLPVHPDQDMSDVVHYLSSKLEDSVDTFIAAVGSPFSVYNTEVSCGDTDLVRELKLVVNAKVDAAIPNARMRVRLVLLGSEFRRREWYIASICIV